MIEKISTHKLSKYNSFFRYYFNDKRENEKKEFFQTTLPFLQRIALDLPKLFKDINIPLLLPYQEQDIELTRFVTSIMIL
jgi:hypothetical protein